MNTKEWYADYINQTVNDIKYPVEPEGLYAPIAYTLAPEANVFVRCCCWPHVRHVVQVPTVR